MIYVTIGQKGADELAAKLRQFGLNTPAVLDRILRYTATTFAGSVRSRYLSGQDLGRVTGDTARLLKARKMRKKPHDFFVSGYPLANIYERGSATRSGLLRPYMTKATHAFDADSAIEAKADQEIRKEIRARGLDG